MKTSADTPKTITASTPSELEQRLEEAVSAARQRAITSGRREGVLITRHDYTLFTVVLDTTVPFGMTLEREEWRPARTETTHC